MSVAGALLRLLGVMIAVAGLDAAAAGFGLAPTGLTIAPNAVSGSVVVTNTGSDELVIQARPYAWSQNGNDVREETRDVVINPPIFKLAAGEQQLVRVAPRGAPLPNLERAYRLIFSEVPRGQAAASAPGFRITIAMDIPLFIEPLVRGTPQVTWRLEQVGDRSRLVAENSGGRHLRWREVQVLDGTRQIESVARVVVLAKSSFVIELPATASGARALQLVGKDDDDQRVAVEVPAAR
jgi:fimbrial chaperone protein